jgi:serine/threonine-protein phosphatase PP1 catalytic subunit
MFLKKHEMDLICRAHQVLPRWLINPRLLKMDMSFSPRDSWLPYSVPQITAVNLTTLVFPINSNHPIGAIMSVDETLLCSFQILKPSDKISNTNKGRPYTPPSKK